MATSVLMEPQAEMSVDELASRLWARRWVLAVTFAVVFGGFGSYALLAPRTYTADASVYAMQDAGLVQSFLDSRNAAAAAARNAGPDVMASLNDEAVSESQLGAAAAEWIEVTGPLDRPFDKGKEPEVGRISVTVRSHEPDFAVALADSLLATLDSLRPLVESKTESELYSFFYDGSNDAEARQRATQEAAAREYWLVLESAAVRDGPSSPNVPLVLTMGGILACVASVFAALAVDRWRRP